MKGPFSDEGKSSSAPPTALSCLAQALGQAAGECGFSTWAISCMLFHVLGWLAAGPSAWDNPGFVSNPDGERIAKEIERIGGAVQHLQHNLGQTMSAVAVLEASLRKSKPQDMAPASRPACSGGLTSTGGMKPRGQAYRIPGSCAREEEGSAKAKAFAAVLPHSDERGQKDLRTAGDLRDFLSQAEWAAAGAASRCCKWVGHDTRLPSESASQSTF